MRWLVTDLLHLPGRIRRISLSSSRSSKSKSPDTFNVIGLVALMLCRFVVCRRLYIDYMEIENESQCITGSIRASLAIGRQRKLSHSMIKQTWFSYLTIRTTVRHGMILNSFPRKWHFYGKLLRDVLTYEHSAHYFECSDWNENKSITLLEVCVHQFRISVLLFTRAQAGENNIRSRCRQRLVAYSKKSKPRTYHMWTSK